jgi:hypothetical protein
MLAVGAGGRATYNPIAAVLGPGKLSLTGGERTFGRDHWTCVMAVGQLATMPLAPAQTVGSLITIRPPVKIPWAWLETTNWNARGRPSCDHP